MAMAHKQPRSSSIGPPKLTLKAVAEDPFLVPQPSAEMPSAAQREWLKAQVALRNLQMQPGGYELSQEAVRRGELVMRPAGSAQAKAAPKAGPRESAARKAGKSWLDSAAAVLFR